MFPAILILNVGSLMAVFWEQLWWEYWKHVSSLHGYLMKSMKIIWDIFVEPQFYWAMCLE